MFFGFIHAYRRVETPSNVLSWIKATYEMGDDAIKNLYILPEGGDGEEGKEKEAKEPREFKEKGDKKRKSMRRVCCFLFFVFCFLFFVFVFVFVFVFLFIVLFFFNRVWNLLTLLRNHPTSKICWVF